MSKVDVACEGLIFLFFLILHIDTHIYTNLSRFILTLHLLSITRIKSFELKTFFLDYTNLSKVLSFEEFDR